MRRRFLVVSAVAAVLSMAWPAAGAPSASTGVDRHEYLFVTGGTWIGGADHWFSLVVTEQEATGPYGDRYSNEVRVYHRVCGQDGCTRRSLNGSFQRGQWERTPDLSYGRFLGSVGDCVVDITFTGSLHSHSSIYPSRNYYPNRPGERAVEVTQWLTRDVDITGTVCGIVPDHRERLRDGIVNRREYRVVTAVPS